MNFIVKTTIISSNYLVDLNIRLSKISVQIPATGRKLFHIGSLEIGFGRHLLIHGSSGKGKTTFLHLLAGLFLPYDGNVFLGESRLNAMTDAQRSHLRRQHFGIVFQKLNLLDHLTALENVKLGLAPRRQSHESPSGSAGDALEQIGMKEFAQTRSGNLSLGEQQRVAVARVLAAKPNIILADEPTSSLDDANAEAITDALLQIAKGKTLVIVSHDHRIQKRFKDAIDFQELVKQ